MVVRKEEEEQEEEKKKGEGREKGNGQRDGENEGGGRGRRTYLCGLLMNQGKPLTAFVPRVCPAPSPFPSIVVIKSFGNIVGLRPSLSPSPPLSK